MINYAVVIPTMDAQGSPIWSRLSTAIRDQCASSSPMIGGLLPLTWIFRRRPRHCRSSIRAAGGRLRPEMLVGG